MNITYLLSPSSLSTVMHDPGKWYDYTNSMNIDFDFLNLNTLFWKLIFSENIFDFINIENKSIFSDISTSLSSLLLKESYHSMEKYKLIISNLSDALNEINLSQKIFTLNVFEGVKVNTVNYSSSSSIIEFIKSESPVKNILKSLLYKYATSIDVLLVKSTSPFSLLTTLLTVGILKEINPNIYVCMIDHSFENFSLLNTKIDFNNNPIFTHYFDSVIKYQNEKDPIVLNLISSLKKGVLPKGLLDFDSFPLDYSKEILDSSPNKFNVIPYTDLFTGTPSLLTKLSPKSCYWSKCSFCTHKSKYSNFNPSNYTLESTVDRLKRYIDAGYETIFFSDEALTPEFLKSLSEIILYKNLKFKWSCRCRFNKNISKTLLKLLQSAGCYEILYGLESTSPTLLTSMNKYDSLLNTNDFLKIINDTNDAGISLHITLIGGLPGESPLDIDNTINFIVDNLSHIPNAVYWLNTFTLFHNCEIYNNPNHYNIKIKSNTLDLSYYSEFEYLQGSYTDKSILINSINKNQLKLFNFLGWNDLTKKHLVTSMVLYLFSTHGVLLKEYNSFYPNKVI